jgi:hypothetical protein
MTLSGRRGQPSRAPRCYHLFSSSYMRIRRSFPIVAGVLIVAAALIIIVQLRKHAPPEPARLLPGADGFLYMNLKWMRRVYTGVQLPAVSHDPEYEQFIQATGFQFERDLDQAAFAIHYSPAPSEPPRFTEVFIGKINGDRLRSYLRKLAGTPEEYGSVDIYNIPLDGRMFRVAMVGVDTVAASNHNDPAVIRGVIDRSRKLASPFRGPALLRRYYRHVPFASLGWPFASFAWAIFRIDPQSSSFPSPGLSFLFTKPATMVASVRYLGELHFKAEAFTASEQVAQRLTEQVSTFLNIFHTAESSVAAQGTDPDVKAFFDGLKVQQNKDRIVLSATISPGFLRKLLTDSQQGTLPPSPQSQSKQPSPNTSQQ